MHGMAEVQSEVTDDYIAIAVSSNVMPEPVAASRSALAALAFAFPARELLD